MLERDVEAINVASGNIFGALDQPLLSCGVVSGMLDQLKEGGGVGEPVANAADREFKGSRRIVGPRFWLSSILQQ